MPRGEGGGTVCSKASADKLLKRRLVITCALHPGCAAVKSVHGSVSIRMYQQQLGRRLIKRASMSVGMRTIPVSIITAFSCFAIFFTPPRAAAGSGAPE